MKYFKHFCDASDNDDFISELEELFGLEGYARWFKLLEAVGGQMKKDGEPAASFSWTKWQTKLKGKRNKLETFLEHCQNKSKLNLKLSGNILEIRIPNMKKIKDEYSRRSGHAPDKLPPIDQRAKSKEQKAEGEGGEKTTPPPPVNSETLPPPKVNGNGHKPPCEVGSPSAPDHPPDPETMAREERRATAAGFLKWAGDEHKRVRESPLAIKPERDSEKIVTLLAQGFLPAALRKAWSEFLVDERAWRNGKTPPKTVPVFCQEIDDLMARTRAQEQEGAREIEENPPLKINPDPEAERVWSRVLKILEARDDMLPDNFATWFEPTEGLDLSREKFLVSVPNRLFVKCLDLNYQSKIRDALKAAGLDPPPPVEFVHNVEVGDV
ncbi:MAG: hypothetical protein GWM98_11620 [Nitrospinaceae bacterium]|nr:hypothetical protein [Nitrospinaceae bacterium]NIR55032.1 hypothetical protein [Nitrospinaceae bacterium]NIS85431.1 hypothetical protein [Nitrospinaceae bacterium]NIT82270.1 hypothetical protein [Nitrospinaceae bacterium]NIU44500.1 hypothetical protein [Nitrospinaceae bacterium]